MNCDTACKVLELDSDINLEKIKKKYREKALLYHPDKNSSPESCKKFQEINEAYQYLLNNNHNEDYEYNSSENSYKKIFMDFLQNIMRENKNWNMNEDVDGEFTNYLFRTILYKLTSLCQEKALEIIEKIEKKSAVFWARYLTKSLRHPNFLQISSMLIL
jgi:DnaJ-class molecular chaperone